MTPSRNLTLLLLAIQCLHDGQLMICCVAYVIMSANTRLRQWGGSIGLTSFVVSGIYSYTD